MAASRYSDSSCACIERSAGHAGKESLDPLFLNNLDMCRLLGYVRHEQHSRSDAELKFIYMERTQRLIPMSHRSKPYTGETKVRGSESPHNSIPYNCNPR